MIIRARLRWALLLVVAAVLARPLAFAQPQPQTSDAGATPTAADASTTSATPDAGTILTSGAGGDDAGVTDPAASSGLTGGPPAQAIQPRPDPTPVQLEALRLLEREVNGFVDRGQGFRASVNGLLAREHERQLSQLRRSFDRQIAAERAAEAEARRHAITVFERFLEMYPEDQEHTPDVMFRLAELYFDESAYAKLDADERMDRLIAERRGQGLPTDDLQPAPVDYRCSVVLYRHIIARFRSYRLADATHYLMGWVLKEMGHEDEAITAYKGLVCPARYHYESEHGFDLMAPLQPTDQPVSCGRLFDILRPRAPELISPPAAAMGDAGAAGQAVPGPAAAVPTADDQPLPIPRDYADCEPLRGANGQASRYAGETWYYIGDYHFDTAHSDEGNAIAIAAYQAAMRASERRRATPATANRQPAAGIQGASPTSREQETAPEAARAQFDANLEYGQFWPKALYKIGWAYFRMQYGYPAALRNFALLLDYYDFAGAEVAAQGNRADTIKWIGVIFSESDWGAGPGDDVTRCQQVVESVARPPTEATRPFDCAGVMRVVSPTDPAQIAAARAPSANNRRPPPVPGRPTYIPQDRPWTPEAYLELANDYFQQTKYYEAITLYRIFLALYPLHFQAPRVAEGIAIAYERQRQFDQAISARGRLADYVEGTPWYVANNDHPDAQRYADRIARDSLHNTAIQHHQQAGQLRARGVAHLNAARAARDRATQASEAAQAVDAFRRADEEYNASVLAYTQFINNYPNDEAAYEFRYNRGDALFWSKRYLEAARAYADVRESNENDQYLVPAAYMAVKSLEMHIRTMAQQRQFDPCLAVRAGIPAAELTDESGAALLTAEQGTQCASLSTTAPPVQGQGATVARLNLPEPVRLLMDARIAYANRVPEAHDTASDLRDVVVIDNEHPENNPPYRPKFAYLNARTLLRYGHLDEANTLYRQIMQTYCQDPVAGYAYADLSNAYVTLGRQEEVENLALEQQRRQCRGVDAGNIGQVLTDREFRLAMQTYQQAERASPAEAGALYERAAREMEAAVRANPNHPQAALAMFYSALAYERTGRFDTATQTYIRITQNYNSTRNAQGEELTGEALSQRVNILEQSNFRAGVNLERIFDYDNAIRYYNNVATDTRFASATDHDAHVHDALASIALITTNLGRWPQARQAWQNFLPRASAGRERSEADFRIAEIPYRAGDWGEAVRSLQDYLRRVPPSADNAQYRVQAQYNIALAYRSANNDAQYRRALREVATVFRQSGQQPGSVAAAWAAEALFRDLDDQVTAFQRNTFSQGDAAALNAQLTRFKDQLRAIDNSAREIVALRGGEYSIAALTRQGEAHEYLATQEVRIAQLVQLSRAQQQTLARAQGAIDQLERAANTVERTNPDQAQQLRDRAQGLRDRIDEQRTEMTRQVQEHFDQEAADERKLAIINYAVAIHTARSQNIPTPYAARALEHLRLEENQPLIDEALSRQNVFQYRPGMFSGEAPGANLSQSTPVATPGLAGE